MRPSTAMYNRTPLDSEGPGSMPPPFPQTMSSRGDTDVLGITEMLDRVRSLHQEHPEAYQLPKYVGPKLKELTLPSIQSFLRRYDKHAVECANIKKPPILLSTCIEDSTLLILASLLRKTTAELTTPVLLSALQDMVGSVERPRMTVAETIKILSGKVPNLPLSTAKGSTFSAHMETAIYEAKVTAYVKERQLFKVFEGEHPRHWIRLLNAGLPSSMRNIVQREMELHDTRRDDIRYWRQRVANLLELFREFSATDWGSGLDASGGRRVASVQVGGKAPVRKCWKCEGDHLLREHPGITRDEVRRIYQEKLQGKRRSFGRKWTEKAVDHKVNSIFACEATGGDPSTEESYVRSVQSDTFAQVSKRGLCTLCHQRRFDARLVNDTDGDS